MFILPNIYFTNLYSIMCSPWSWAINSFNSFARGGHCFWFCKFCIIQWNRNWTSPSWSKKFLLFFKMIEIISSHQQRRWRRRHDADKRTRSWVPRRGRRLLTKILSGSCKKSAQFLLEGGGEEYFKALTMPTDEVGEGEKLSKDEESDEVVVIEW